MPLVRPSAEVIAQDRRLDLRRRFNEPRELPYILADLSRLDVGFLIWHREGFSPPVWDDLVRRHAPFATLMHVDDELALFHVDAPVEDGR